jgi:hypothetical protein
MVTKSHRPTNVTIKVDSLVLLQARYRALCEGTSLNGLVRQFIEEYAETAISDPAALWGHLAAPDASADTVKGP